MFRAIYELQTKIKKLSNIYRNTFDFNQFESKMCLLNKDR